MLIDYYVSGYKSFNNEIYFTMETDNYIKKNKENIFELETGNLVKSAIIYGPNNTGKSAFISSIGLLKELILGRKTINEVKEDETLFNFYTDEENKIIKFKIKFLIEKSIYEYGLEIKYNYGIINEFLTVNNVNIFNTNNIEDNQEEVKNLIKIYAFYKDKLIVSTLPREYIKHAENIKKVFENIVIFKGNGDAKESIDNFNLEGVYNFLNTAKEKEIKLLNKFISHADISIKEIKLANQEKEIDNTLKINSIHSNKKTSISAPSVFIESDGSKKFIRYIAEMIRAFQKGKIILIDEIDSSLHTVLTKSLIALFNNEDNKNTQLITTSHDLLLLDTDYLFRKDQIWFIHKDNEEFYLYSLDDIKANDGARNKTMISYLKGMFGALPNPKIGEILSEKKK